MSQSQIFLLLLQCCLLHWKKKNPYYLLVSVRQNLTGTLHLRKPQLAYALTINLWVCSCVSFSALQCWVFRCCSSPLSPSLSACKVPRCSCKSSSCSSLWANIFSRVPTLILHSPSSPCSSPTWNSAAWWKETPKIVGKQMHIYIYFNEESGVWCH